MSFDLLDFYHNRSHLIGVDRARFTPAEIGEIASALLPGFESNALKAPAIETIPFEDDVRTYEKVASGQAKVKEVLTFHRDT